MTTFGEGPRRPRPSSGHDGVPSGPGRHGVFESAGERAREAVDVGRAHDRRVAAKAGRGDHPVVEAAAGEAGPRGGLERRFPRIVSLEERDVRSIAREDLSNVTGG